MLRPVLSNKIDFFLDWQCSFIFALIADLSIKHAGSWQMIAAMIGYCFIAAGSIFIMLFG